MNFKRLLFLVKVEGLSCWPFLRPGQSYLATSLSQPKIGDFVVFRDKNNQSRFLVKRVLAKKRDGYLAFSTFPQPRRNENSYAVPTANVEGKLLGIVYNNVLN